MLLLTVGAEKQLERMGKRKGKRLIVVSLGSTGWWDVTQGEEREKKGKERREKRGERLHVFSLAVGWRGRKKVKEGDRLWKEEND